MLIHIVWRPLTRLAARLTAQRSGPIGIAKRKQRRRRNGENVGSTPLDNRSDNVEIEIDGATLTEDNSEDEKHNDPKHDSGRPTLWQRLYDFGVQQEFLLSTILAVVLARAYPPLGADYLQPDITATWLAVGIIFFLAGLGLKTEELANAFQQIRFNVFVQCFNFFVLSAIVYGVSRGLAAATILNPNLADGMVVCSTLSVTVNTVQVLTVSSNGDEAAAIFNAAFGNLVGVFLSPTLILGYLGVTGNIDLIQVFYKLLLRVVIPVIVGQVLRCCFKSVVAFAKNHKRLFKIVQQWCLVFIVYTVFCETFINRSNTPIGDIFLMILFQFLLLTALMLLAWQLLRIGFPSQPKLRVMGLFGCTHKSVAIGVPLINAIYAGSPKLGLYTLPLLIWHPMQLVVGTFLSPRLAAFVVREEIRLHQTEVNESATEEPEIDEENGEKSRTVEKDQGVSRNGAVSIGTGAF